MANALAKPSRRWFRFSLRTLFVLLTVCGVSVGWVLREWQIVRERQDMRVWLQSQTAWDASVGIWETSSLCGPFPRQQKLATLKSPPQRTGQLPFIRRWLGDEYVEGILLCDALADRRHEIELLFPESTIALESEAERERDAAAHRRIVKALSEPTRFDFENISLQDAVVYLKYRHDLEIQFDAKALEDAYTGVDVPVSYQAHEIPLHEALTGLLTPLELRFVIRHAVLLITVQDEEQESD